MKASQLIRELQNLVAKHGDLECGRQDCSYGCSVVYRVGLSTAKREGFSTLDDDEELVPQFFEIG